MFHSSFAHLQFSPQLLYWHSNLFPPAILCVAAPKKQTVVFPTDKLDIVKPGVVWVNDVPQIQPMLRGLGLEWAGKVQHDSGVGTGPDAAGDG